MQKEEQQRLIEEFDKLQEGKVKANDESDLQKAFNNICDTFERILLTDSKSQTVQVAVASKAAYVLLRPVFDKLRQNKEPEKSAAPTFDRTVEEALAKYQAENQRLSSIATGLALTLIAATIVFVVVLIMTRSNGKDVKQCETHQTYTSQQYVRLYTTDGNGLTEHLWACDDTEDEARQRYERYWKHNAPEEERALLVNRSIEAWQRHKRK